MRLFIRHAGALGVALSSATLCVLMFGFLGCGQPAPETLQRATPGLRDGGEDMGVGHDLGQERDAKEDVSWPLPESVYTGALSLGAGTGLPQGDYETTLTLNRTQTGYQGVLFVQGQGGYRAGIALKVVLDQAQGWALDVRDAACVAPDGSLCAVELRAIGALVGRPDGDKLVISGQGAISQVQVLARTDLYIDPHDGFRPSTAGPPSAPPLSTRPAPTAFAGDWYGAMWVYPTIYDAQTLAAGAGCLMSARTDAQGSPQIDALRCMPHTDFTRINEAKPLGQVSVETLDLERGWLSFTAQRDDGLGVLRYSGALDHQLVMGMEGTYKLYRFFGVVSWSADGLEGWQTVGSFAMGSWGADPE